MWQIGGDNMFYDESCAYYTRKVNKAGYVTNYCNKNNKFLSGLANCEDCFDYDIKLPDEMACEQFDCPKNHKQRCCKYCGDFLECEIPCDVVVEELK